MNRKIVSNIILAILIVTVSIVVITNWGNVKTEKNVGEDKPVAEPVPQGVIDRLSATLTEPYSIKDGKIYYQDTLMEGVDVATFETFPAPHLGFSKDKNHVYYVRNVVKGADPATFEFISNDYSGRARDKNRVYIGGEPIEGADPKTYELIKGTNYAKDKTYVFINTIIGAKQLPGADPATFEPLSGPYSKDKNAVYFVHYDYHSNPIRIENSDPATFVDVKDEKGETIYFKDKNQVYHVQEGVLEGSDPATFEFLVSRYAYARDAKNIYFRNIRMPSADMATFKVLGDDYAEDKNYLYKDGKIIFDLSKGVNPFEQAAAHILDITPKGDAVIDYIVNTYYDLTLFYGNCCEYNIFELEDKYKDSNTFFEPFFKGLKRSTFDLASFVPFRLAFVAPHSPASLFYFPQPIGPGIGGEVVGRKLLDPDTMLVYGKYGGQSYLGAAGPGCKGQSDIIDKFIFKKIGGEWKIFEIEEGIDSWTTVEDSSTATECPQINQDRDKKYRL